MHTPRITNHSASLTRSPSDWGSLEDSDQDIVAAGTVGLPEGGGVHCLAVGDLRGGPVSDEERLPAPLEGHVLTCHNVM